MRFHLSTRATLWVFLVMVVFIIVQGAWWVVFMARLADEKVDIARELGGDDAYVERIHEQEVARQIMIGTEGTVFLLVLLGGLWLIHNTHMRTVRLRSQQQNFMMAVTHELKTPLASMQLYLDSLASDKISEERKQGVVPRMRQDVKRLEGMVENILEAGRFDRHARKLSVERVDFSSIVEAAVKTVAGHPSEVTVELERDIEPGVIVDGDAVMLGRAVHAVLDNALKYHDGTRAAVRVHLHTVGRRAVLTVTDQGIGLEKGETDAVFDRFYRVGSELTRTVEGSGLGLYLCREMVRAHKGEVTARSEGLGKGTQFEISVPLTR